MWSPRDRRKLRRTFRGPGATAEAKGWITDARKGVRDRTLRAPTTQTLEQAVEEFIDGARGGRILTRREEPYRRKVIDEYERVLKQRVLPLLGRRRLSDIDYGDLIGLKEHLLAQGYGGGSVHNAFTPLKAILRRAQRAGLIAVNPSADLPLPTSNARDRAASVREAVELLAPLPGPVVQGIHGAAFLAGLRRGELRSLRVRDVDLDAGVIDVKRGWDDVAGETLPKTKAGIRLVFVLEALRPYLQPLVDDREGDELVFGVGDSLAFEPKNVTRKATNAWTKENKSRAECEAPLLVPLTLHVARHSFASWMAAAGIPEANMARYLGHAGGTITRRYTHALDGQLAADAKRLDAYIADVLEGVAVPLPAGSSAETDDAIDSTLLARAKRAGMKKTTRSTVETT